MYEVVVKTASVFAHCRALEHYPVSDVSGLVLFFDSSLNIACGVANLQPAVMGRNAYVLIGINHRDFGHPVAK